MRIFVIIFLLSGGILFCSENGARAQTSSKSDSTSWLKGWTIAPCFLHGKIFKHTPNFEPEIKSPSNAFELNITKQVNGKEWHQIHHYPSLGIAVAFTNYGNDEVLGHALSFMPNIDLPLIGSNKKFSLRLRLGSGIAFLSKHYDYTENPTNNVIASTVNDITSFAISGNWRFANQWTLFAGGSFTHFSTGAVKVPNLGINIPAWNVGLRFQPDPYRKKEFIKRELTPPTKKILFDVCTGLGFQEQLPANGPMYHVFLLQFSAGRMITRWNKLSIGAAGSYKEAATSFIKQEEIYPDHFFLNSCAASGFIKDDILFGFVGISILAGYNFHHPSPLEYDFYQKIGIPVYLPAFGKEKNDRFSIGVFVTAGDFTADFVSVDLGFQF